MHYPVKFFISQIKREFPYKFRLRKVLEVGSHNINGSPREYFDFCDYTGVDIYKGKGVDIVGKITDKSIKLKSDSFDLVISTEMLEHDNEWADSLKKMYDLLKPAGLLIVTCAAPARKEHGTKRTSTEWCSPDTSDYYQNISLSMFRKVVPDDLFEMYMLQYAQGENDLQFYGIKKGKSNGNRIKEMKQVLLIWFKNKFK